MCFGLFLWNSGLRLVNIMTVQTFRDHQHESLGASGACLSFFWWTPNNLKLSGRFGSRTETILSPCFWMDRLTELSAAARWFWGSERRLAAAELVWEKKGPFFLSRKEIGGPNPEVFHSNCFWWYTYISYMYTVNIQMYTVDMDGLLCNIAMS